jgi:hypothetical protein
MRFPWVREVLGDSVRSHFSSRAVTCICLKQVCESHIVAELTSRCDHVYRLLFDRFSVFDEVCYDLIPGLSHCAIVIHSVHLRNGALREPFSSEWDR